MDKLTIFKTIDIINEHIAEINSLPGNPIGKEQVINELKLLIKELKEAIKK